MNKLLILGPGSVFYLKRREDQFYREPFLFLNKIESISINGQEVSFENVEFGSILDCLGYKPGKTHITWIVDEESKGLFDLGIEYILPDANSYKIKVLHISNDSLLGDVFLLDIINVNGNDIMTHERVLPEGVLTADAEV